VIGGGGNLQAKKCVLWGGKQSLIR